MVKVESALLHSRKSALINSLKSALAHFPKLTLFFKQMNTKGKHETRHYEPPANLVNIVLFTMRGHKIAFTSSEKVLVDLPLMLTHLLQKKDSGVY